MVHNQIFRRGITEQKILAAFTDVPRHLFVPLSKRNSSYEDYPLSIGAGQTISQPYIVALMTKVLDVCEGQKVLEIGTGSGYQAAILAHLGVEVYSVERISSLAHNAKETLARLGYSVRIHVGDGTLGWQEHSPYERIVVTAATPGVSPYWMKQLNVGGKLVVPLGGPLRQDLTVAQKVSDNDIQEDIVCGCMFVPLIGKYGYRE
ncbi:MAG: protein-L-isoaspartate(D-aspartate) O-methyltransferase [Candidatus Omnitrophota bacterium]|nr:MAG: protein-L-isoaspartate(D-aspartate) O-methyltransferase [Candidatus Omnitrophota bacterium]